MLRWIVRVVRAERRQHALVIAMIGLGISIAVVLVTTSVRLNQPQQAIDGFENELLVRTFSEDLETVDRFNREAAQLIERHDDLSYVVTSRTESQLVQVFGATPTGSAIEQRYDLLEGQWPSPGEIAITRRAGERLTAAGSSSETIVVGGSATIDGQERLVSGAFEDRWRIDDAVVIAHPQDVTPYSTVRFFLPSIDHPIVSEAFGRWAIEDDGDAEQPIQAFVSDTTQTGDSDASAVGGAYLIGTVLALQIAILASAGFTVLAQRRTRQFGMLSAMGASPRQLASVLRTTGLVVGAIGGFVGLVVGVLIAIVASPLVQLAVPHRLNRFELPWLALLPMIPLAVGTSMLAAWWPSRRIRRMSAIDTIGARRPSGGRVMPSALVGFGLAAAGTWLTIAGAPRNSPPMLVGGVVALTVGALLIVPWAVAVLGGLADWAWLPVRIGWRDLNRNRSRSAAAAAAAAMAIAVPFGVATFIASLDSTWRPQLPANTVSFDGAFMWDNETGERDVAIDGVHAAIEPFREVAPNLDVLSFDLPVVAGAAEQFGHDGAVQYSVRTIRQSGTQATLTAFATDELLAVMGLNSPGDGVDVITTLTTPLDLPDEVNIEQQTARYQGFPHVLLINEIENTSRDAVIRGRWYLQKPTDFTQVELDRMEAIAERSPDGLFISGYETRPPFLAMRLAALAVSGLLGLSVVAVAVALIRTENEGEARSLNAIGASPRTGRQIGAATSAGLAWVAVAVAMPAAFALLAGIYLNPDEEFDFAMPWLELAGTGLVIPAIAAGGGWLLTTNQVKRLST